MTEGKGKASQYFPTEDRGKLERTAVGTGKVIDGEPIQAVLKGGTFKTQSKDFGRPVGADAGQKVNTILGEYSSGNIHGHPRKF